jgi:hypothetical protein
VVEVEEVIQITTLVVVAEQLELEALVGPVTYPVVAEQEQQVQLMQLQLVEQVVQVEVYMLLVDTVKEQRQMVVE